MSGLLARFVAAITLVVVLLAPVADAAGAAFGWDPIQCCCGEHAGDEACGCPDCPAGHQNERDDDGDDDGDDRSPGLRACGATGHVAVPGGFAEAILPAPPVLIAPIARNAPRPPAVRPPGTVAARPEKPPS